MLAAVRLLAASACGADPGVIRGVYVDHGVTLQSAKFVGYDVPKSITRRLGSVPAGTNLVWVTNLPDDPSLIAHYVRTARARGVEVVAGSGWWYAYKGRADEQFARLQRLFSSLPSDGRPCRWSLGDETALEALDDLRMMADRATAAGIPTTMVQVPEFHERTLDTLQARLPIISCDVYPSFYAGLGPVDPIAWAKSTHMAAVTRSRTAGVRPLLMTQGFGDASLFAMPSPARVRWQIWSAVAAGSPGAVVFAHGVPWTMPDGSPASLVDPSTETLTANGTAVAATFSRMKSIEGRLAGATLDTAPAWGSVGLRGDCAAIFRPASGPRLLLVVADPDATGQRTLKITLPGVSRITPLAESTGATLQALPWPWSLWFPATLQVSLQPGDAWVGELR